MLTYGNISLAEMGHGYLQLLLCFVLGLPVSPGKHHQGGGQQPRGRREIYLRNHPRWGCFTPLCRTLLGWTVHLTSFRQVIFPVLLLPLLFKVPTVLRCTWKLMSCFQYSHVRAGGGPCVSAHVSWPWQAAMLSSFCSFLADLQQGWNIRALLHFTAK